MTRIPSDVQDALITILSEKTLPGARARTEVQAAKGFNVIATANDRDRGVNELSSALRRRFNTVVLPLPADRGRGGRRSSPAASPSWAARSSCPDVPAALEEIRRVVHGLPRAARPGRPRTADDQAQVAVRHAVDRRGDLGHHQRARARRRTSATVCSGAPDVAAGIVGAVVKDPVPDSAVWTEYLEAVVRERTDWADFYRACRDVSG